MTAYMTVVWLIGGLLVTILLGKHLRVVALLKQRVRNLRSELHDLHGENWHILEAELDAEEASKQPSGDREPRPDLPDLRGVERMDLAYPVFTHIH